MEWSQTNLHPLIHGGNPGLRIRAIDPIVGARGHIIWFPGRMWRVFWNDGTQSDFPTRANAETALEHDHRS